VLFTVYNGVAAIAALTLLPLLARRIGRVRTHIIACCAARPAISASSSSAIRRC
jgi:hypothetical protein